MVTMDHVPRHTAALPASSHHSAGFKFKILPICLAAAFASCQHGFRECVTSSALQAVSLCHVLLSNLALFSPPQVVDFVGPLISRAMFLAGFSYNQAGIRFPYYYGFGSTATTDTQNAQQAYLFFQVLTLVLSIACATLCNVLLAYTYARPSDSYADKFSESVKISVRIVFRLLLFAHITYCSALVLIGFVFFPDSKFALYACVTVFTALLLYTILVVVGTAKTFVDIEAMTVEEVAAQLQQTSAAVADASQSNFESSTEFRIGVLNSLGGSAVLLLAFAVTAISRYIPQSSCVFNNGRLGTVASPFSPTPVLPPMFVTLWRSHSYLIDSCAHKQLKRQSVRGICVNFLFQYSILFRLEFLATCVQAEPSGTIYIVAAIAAAFCGYLTSLHGLLLSTLVSNFEPAPKFACKKTLFMHRLEKVWMKT